MSNNLPLLRISKLQLDQFKNQSNFVAFSLSVMTGISVKGIKFNNAFASLCGYGSFVELEHSSKKFKSNSSNTLNIVTPESLPVMSKVLAEKFWHINLEDAETALNQLITAIDRRDIPRSPKPRVPKKQKKVKIPKLPATAYASTVLLKEKYILKFTTLGEQIYQQALSLLPKENCSFSFEKVTSSLDELIAAHPNNPWPKAIKVSWLFEFKFQGSWIENLPFDPKKGFAPDYPHRAEYMELCEQNANELFADAKDAVSLFSSIFLDSIEDNKKKLLISLPMASNKISRKNCETYYWPVILFYGGCIAMNCGKYSYARKWFLQYQKITGNNDFDVNSKLAALSLIDNGGLIKRIYKDGEIDAWGQILLATQCYEKGELILAFDHFSNAMIQSWGALEAFGNRLEGAKALKIRDAKMSPALVHELMFVTREFWNKNSNAFSFFQTITENSELRSALLAYHKAESALLEEGITSAVREKRDANLLASKATYDDLIIKMLSSKLNA